jgi:hypothetical protein
MTASCFIFLLGLQVAAIAADTNAVEGTNNVVSTNTLSTSIAAKPPGAVRKDFDAFRIIAQRNIFNPNRSAHGGGRPSGGERTRAPRAETFTLVGTMLYEGGQFAFFDSSSSSYKKVIKAGDSIAGYKVNEVMPNGAKLEAKGKTISLSVGQKMRKQDGGEWNAVGAGAAEVDTNSSTSETTSTSGESDTSSTSAASDSSADEDEAVKRLMKKREEEMKK